MTMKMLIATHETMEHSGKVQRRLTPTSLRYDETLSRRRCSFASWIRCCNDMQAIQ